MTNLERMLEMQKKIAEMSIEVTKGINNQIEQIEKCREERALELYEYFEGIRHAIGADVDWEARFCSEIKLGGSFSISVWTETESASQKTGERCNLATDICLRQMV